MKEKDEPTKSNEECAPLYTIVSFFCNRDEEYKFIRCARRRKL